MGWAKAGVENLSSRVVAVSICQIATYRTRSTRLITDVAWVLASANIAARVDIAAGHDHPRSASVRFHVQLMAQRPDAHVQQLSRLGAVSVGALQCLGNQ